MDGTEAAAVASTTAEVLDKLKKHAYKSEQYYTDIVDKLKDMGKGDDMTDLATLAAIGGGNRNDGMMGGGGLIGGLILGSLLRNNGNLLGGDGAGAVAGATLRNPPEQNQANMDIMAAIGGVDKSVAISTATMEASQATQTLGITTQLNNVASSLAARTDGVKDAVNSGTMVLAQQLNGVQQQVMQNRYELAKDISTDGDKTRALITAQYEATLNRQLSDANAAVIALQSRFDTAERTRGIEVTTTNNINQMQQQQQQQTQFSQLANMVWGLSQSIRDNNSAINVGSGTQTSTNTPTNTNIR